MNTVAIDQIVTDPRCQSRQGIELGLVQEYAEAIRDGVDMPPISVVQSGDSYYLYDGFHRLRAYEQVGKREVSVESVPGDVWDAIERSCAVNAIHGKRRTNEDKRRAVETMIQVMEHRGENWSDSEIARRCAVSQPFVSGIRPSLITDISDSPKTYTDRWGNQSTMNTANIGKYRAPKIDLDDIDFDDDYADEDGVIEHDVEPISAIGIAPKTKDNYRPSADVDTWFEVPGHDGDVAYRYLQRNMLPEAFEVLRRRFTEGAR